MPNRLEYTAISVQSRKGGVGKTTAALHMARQFLPDITDDTHGDNNNAKNIPYNVLFFDLDLTGTDAGEIAHQPMWEHDIHVVADPDSKDDLNLITLFERYMAGKDLPPMSFGKSRGALELKPGRINVFSSYLDSNAGADNDKKGKSFGPQALFDELHSGWFIDMLKEIIESAIRDQSGDGKSKRETLVIIDGAPGYTGIQPVLREWLTDMGPERGKFLFVFTMDAQDFTGTLKTIGAAHQTFHDKWEASREYIKTRGTVPASPLLLKGKQQAFFTRLAETQPLRWDKCGYPAPDVRHKTCTDCNLCYYRQPDVAPLPPKTKQIHGKLIAEAPEKYIALIGNKIPGPFVEREREGRLHPPEVDYDAAHLLKDFGFDPPGKIIRLKELPKILSTALEKKETKSKVPKELSAPGLPNVLDDLENRLIPYDEDWALIFMSKNYQIIEKSDHDIGDDKSEKVRQVVTGSPENRLEIIRELQHKKIYFSKEH